MDALGDSSGAFLGLDWIVPCGLVLLVFWAFRMGGGLEEPIPPGVGVVDVGFGNVTRSEHGAEAEPLTRLRQGL